MPYTSNPDLKTISLPFEWKGTPVLDNGRFVNLNSPFNDSLLQLLKWQLQKNPQKEEKRKDTWRPEVVSDSNFIGSKQDCIVWLGHASFFIRLAGITMLIDPILLNSIFLKRLCPLPVSPEEFKNLDYIFISHDHRDHCDEKSIRLLATNNPDATWLTGLNMEKILYTFSGSKNIQSAGWYQQFGTKPEVKITFVPSRHWGKRGLNDTNLRLWGGYVIEAAGKTIYFCGDSGYDSHFSDVGRIFPEIDYCMVGIGAYKPEFFMGQSHTSPADALRAFQDTKAKTMIPMHYGTFDLADEPVGDPVRALEQIENSDGEIRFLKIGEVFL